MSPRNIRALEAKAGGDVVDGEGIVVGVMVGAETMNNFREMVKEDIYNDGRDDIPLLDLPGWNIRHGWNNEWW